MTEIKVVIPGIEELTAAVRELTDKMGGEIVTIDIPEFQKEPEKPKNQEKAPEKPSIDPSTVKTELANISRSGKQQEVKDLISSYGVKMLSAVPDDKLEELLAKARAL